MPPTPLANAQYRVASSLGWLSRSVSVIVPADSATETSSIVAVGTASSLLMVTWASASVPRSAPDGLLSSTLKRFAVP